MRRGRREKEMGEEGDREGGEGEREGEREGGEGIGGGAGKIDRVPKDRSIGGVHQPLVHGWSSLQQPC